MKVEAARVNSQVSPFVSGARQTFSNLAFNITRLLALAPLNS